MSDRIRISDYAQLGHRVDLSAVEKDRIVADLNETGGPVLVLERWLVEKKDIVPMRAGGRVYRVTVLDESDKAWHVATGEERDWIPKSQSEVLERDGGVEEIATPSSTLADFGGTA